MGRAPQVKSDWPQRVPQARIASSGDTVTWPHQHKHALSMWARTRSFATPEATLMQWADAFYVNGIKGWQVRVYRQTSQGVTHTDIADELNPLQAMQKLAEIEDKWQKCAAPQMVPTHSIKQIGASHFTAQARLMGIELDFKADETAQIDLPNRQNGLNDRLYVPTYPLQHFYAPDTPSEARRWRKEFDLFVKRYNYSGPDGFERLWNYIIANSHDVLSKRLMWGAIEVARTGRKGRMHVPVNLSPYIQELKLLQNDDPALYVLYKQIRDQGQVWRNDFGPKVDQAYHPSQIVLLMQAGLFLEPAAQATKQLISGFGRLQVHEQAWFLEHCRIHNLLDMDQKVAMFDEAVVGLDHHTDDICMMLIDMGVRPMEDRHDSISNSAIVMNAALKIKNKVLGYMLGNGVKAPTGKVAVNLFHRIMTHDQEGRADRTIALLIDHHALKGISADDRTELFKRCVSTGRRNLVTKITAYKQDCENKRIRAKKDNLREARILKKHGYL